MDSHTHKAAAREVGAALASVIDKLAADIADSLENGEIRLGQMLKAKSEDLDRAASERDRALVVEQAKKLTAMRSDLASIVHSIAEANETRMAAAKSEIALTVQRAMAALEGRLVDAIAAANRDTYDALLAEIHGIKSTRKEA